MKVKKAIVCILLAIILTFMLTACGTKLSGTYRSDGVVAQELRFDGDKVTMTAFGINVSGTYKISKGHMDITYSVFGSEQTMTMSFEKSGRDIYLDGTLFVKQ